MKARREDTPRTGECAQDDFSRPLYHFTPPSNWMNDPNGPVRYQGEYHLFYQHNPHAPSHASMHWGHAKSPDMIRWTDLPIALAPGPQAYDKDGIYSGSAVVDNGKPTLVYTGVQPEVQCLATSGDDMLTWQKHHANPVLLRPPAIAETLVGFRDPFLWREGDCWYMLVGSGFRGIGGTALVFRATDLTRWEYLHPLLEGTLSTDGEMWECPTLFPLGGKHILLVSVNERVLGWVGTMRDLRFTPERRFYADLGDCYYATQCQLESPDGPVVYAWGWSWRRCREDGNRGKRWAGVLALPRIFSLLFDGSVGVAPLEAISSLRGARTTLSDIRLSDGPGGAGIPVDVLRRLRGTSVEISAVFEEIDAHSLGMRVLSNPLGTEETRIQYDLTTNALTVDSTRSAASADPGADAAEARIVGGPTGLSPSRIELRVFVDRSLIEVFLNQRVALTTRVYPTDARSSRIEPFVQGGSCRLSSLSVWDMKPCLSGRSE